ncbi:TPA: ribbon-helix-helix protein, CopG family [Burkholderia multivorans]|nr:ribbon-helix-helix protein, CopG family [Burkholderia multivorans]
MAKKQAQFRFDEDFYADLTSLAEREGVSLSEVVRNALKLYAALYERSKDRRARFFLQYDDTNERCEVILPW